MQGPDGNYIGFATGPTSPTVIDGIRNQVRTRLPAWRGTDSNLRFRDAIPGSFVRARVRRLVGRWRAASPLGPGRGQGMEVERGSRAPISAETGLSRAGSMYMSPPKCSCAKLGMRCCQPFRGIEATADAVRVGYAAWQFPGRDQLIADISVDSPQAATIGQGAARSGTDRGSATFTLGYSEFGGFGLGAGVAAYIDISSVAPAASLPFVAAIRISIPSPSTSVACTVLPEMRIAT
jgi:hypothetical protein